MGQWKEKLMLTFDMMSKNRVFDEDFLVVSIELIADTTVFLKN